MTGVRERLGVLGSDAALAPPDLETGILEYDRDPSTEPNDSYELREMVSVASAYLGQGMLDDADELLREVLDAGYSRPDAFDLLSKIDDVRGAPLELMLNGATNESSTRSPARVSFTLPLPGVERLPLNVQQMIRESDADLRAGRNHAALDAALYVIGSAPDYYPMFVRLAEIELSQGRRESASQLTATLMTCLQDAATGQEWLLYPVRLALDPDDSSTLVEYARQLLGHPGLASLDPFVPNAILRTLESDPPTAQELARDYFKTMPLSDGALRLHIRAAMASGDRDAVVNAITANVRPDSAADLLILRSAIGATRSRNEWIEWLERAVVELQRDAELSADVISALHLIQRMVQPVRAHLTIAIASLAGEQAGAAREAVSHWTRASTDRSADRLDAFLSACVEARSADLLDAADALEAHLTVVALAVDGAVRDFAESCHLFNGSVRSDALLERTIAIAHAHGRQDDAIEYLRDLRDREPEALEVRSAIATICLDQDRVADGVRELRYVAERKDAAGDVDGMVKAMRRISEALPTNVEVKSKIVEGFLQRGVLEEAMVELELLGELQSQRGKPAAAIIAFTRGADVAAAIGNFKRATEFLDHAVMADPESDAVRHEAVAFFLRIGAVDRAVQQLWELVRIAINAQDPDEAVAALHQIIALTPNDPSAYHKLGEVLASLGEYMQAEKVYRRLSTLTPDDPVLNAKQAALAALATPR